MSQKLICGLCVEIILLPVASSVLSGGSSALSEELLTDSAG